MRIPIYICTFLVLFPLLIAGCASTNNGGTKENIMSLTEVLKSELSSVDEIDVDFGDGNKMSITDPSMIQDITTQLKSINVRETDSKGVGYLYYLNLKEGDKSYRLGSDLTIDGTSYEPIDDEAKKLNDFIIKMGRDKFPGLLSGVK